MTLKTPPTRRCQVLVVGAGPVGLMLAGLLAQIGLDVAVLERRTAPRQYSRAIGLHPPALAVLNLIGLKDAALAAGLRVHVGQAYSRGRLLGALSFQQAWPDDPYVLVLPQNRTEALLRQRLTEVAPAALHTGWDVTSAIEHHDGVTVTARSAHPAPGEPTHDDGAADDMVTWQADVVIGADGPHSVIRREAGIRRRTRSLPDTYLMGDFAGADVADPLDDDSDRSDHAIARIYLESGGVVESFPLPGNQRRWVAHTGNDPLNLPDASAEHLAALIADRTGQTVDPRTATMTSAFSVRRRVAQRMVAGRTVLIGDAAHEISPIGGQGLTLGWLDALELVPLLYRVVQRNNPGPLNRIPVFRTFEATRLAAARATARQAEMNMTMGRPVPQLVGSARNAALRAVLGTGLKHRVARAFTMRQPIGGAEVHVPR